MSNMYANGYDWNYSLPNSTAQKSKIWIYMKRLCICQNISETLHKRIKLFHKQIYIYLYIHTHTHTHTHTHIYIYIERERESERKREKYVYIYIYTSIYVYIHICMYIYIYIYDTYKISFQTFFIRAFKIVVDSWNFTMLLLYTIWDDWAIFMFSGSNEQPEQEFEYTLLKPDCHNWWI